MKLKYSETFYSVQGEGKFVGVPSVFLRTFGCNFRCMNFGLPRGTPMRADQPRHNAEVKALIDSNIISKTETFTDLPIIHTGCDTYASIYPEFKELMMNHHVDEVVDNLLALTPQGKWTMDNGQDVHLILTGGEPMMWQLFWIELLDHPRMQDLKNITIETNGTRRLTDKFAASVLHHDVCITWSCSPKLTVSGEAWETAIKPAVIKSYLNVTTTNDEMYLKFVVADTVDIEEAECAVKEYREAGIDVPVYLMPLGGRSEDYNLNVDEVARICLDRGWRFSPRLHISLFGNAWGT